jgi:signal transduction histidine kinase
MRVAVTSLVDRIDRTLSDVVPSTGASATRWRLGASGSICLTGLVLLIPNVSPLATGPGTSLGGALALLGAVLSAALVGAGYLLARSDIEAPNTVRIAIWNLLGVTVLGAVLALHYLNQSYLGADLVAAPITVGNVLAIGAVAHVIIGVHDARRVRAEAVADQREKLAVLNRVLRHNLRTEANVLSGYADLIVADVDDPDLIEAATTIQQSAATVGSLAEGAGRIVDATARRGEVHDPVDATAVATDAVTAVSERFPDASTTCLFPTTDTSRLWVRAGDGLRTALDELLENAVVHADRPDPTVAVTVTEHDGQVAVTVADDGPGVPEIERDVVAGDREITQLTHGSGLGLWTAKAVTEAAGGWLSFGSPTDDWALQSAGRVPAALTESDGSVSGTAVSVWHRRVEPPAHVTTATGTVA